MPAPEVEFQGAHKGRGAKGMSAMELALVERRGRVSQNYRDELQRRRAKKARRRTPST